jgi:sterol desaturase/sphingolipid hydroxylase (fatty acid hydroxylase superfamily)
MTTETDSNYGSLYSFWDRLFRSFRLRAQPGTLEFGLEDFNRPEDHTLVSLFTTPLKRKRHANNHPNIGER